MKIVVDISEKQYESLKNLLLPSMTERAILNGTVLPKGHGDLKDYDAIKSEYIRKMNVFMSEEERMDLLCTIVDEAEVVIGADKEAEDG